MPFDERVKLEAMERANFRCSVCQELWVEVHHIEPQAEGGPDTLANAAPLCGSCHTVYGGNRSLRKQLRRMRDHWWRRCAQSRPNHELGAAVPALLKYVHEEAASPTSPTKIREALAVHFQQMKSWSSLTIVEPKAQPRNLADLYVDLDLDTVDPDGKPTRMGKVSDITEYPGSVAILGDPGGGKTTALQKLLHEHLRGKRPGLPLLVVLRELGSGESLFGRLIDLLGVATEEFRKSSPSGWIGRLEFLAPLMGTLGCTLYLDGLDELNEDLRRVVIGEIRAIGEAAPTVAVVVSCRTADYRTSLGNVTVLKLSGLTKAQARTLAGKWLKDRKLRDRFMKAIENSTYAGTVVRPLNLAVLALLFIRTGGIPDRPREVYEKLIRLFIEDWDESRNVLRESRYAGFTPGRKEAFLEALAHRLVIAGINGGRFTHVQLVNAYDKVRARFDLPKHEATAVAREVESHTGLILQRGEREYEFFHLTVFEYLAAKHVVRAGSPLSTNVSVKDHEVTPGT